jgi:hypothetical protein
MVLNALVPKFAIVVKVETGVGLSFLILTSDATSALLFVEFVVVSFLGLDCEDSVIESDIK